MQRRYISNLPRSVFVPPLLTAQPIGRTPRSLCVMAADAAPATAECVVRIPPQLLAEAREAGQEHIFAGWHQLTAAQRERLLTDASAVGFKHLQHALDTSAAAVRAGAEQVEPVRSITTQGYDHTQADLSPTDWQRLTAVGFRLIAEGKLGVLLLAGGQGTRLGSAAPKGCFDVGLPSHKSLFQLQAERIRRLQQLAAAAEGGGAVRQPVHWYIMTSPATDAATRRFFGEQRHFGLLPEQIHFFQQGQMPCVTEDGRLILAAADRLAWAPDGNGGVYSALKRAGLLDHMAAAGVEAVDCCSVDNALVLPGEPLFAGHCWEAGAGCGAKVVAKAHPDERVGVFAQRGGAIEVVEYSELDPALASAADPGTGRLFYNWSNVCMHFFRRSFLEGAALRLHDEGRFHVARKRIPSVEGPVKGTKLELFIFDTFPMADSVALLEVPRSEQFAPVKNAAGGDSPATARQAVLDLHSKWVAAAGGVIAPPEGSAPVSHTEAAEGEEESATADGGSVAAAGGAAGGHPARGIEVSPLVSYMGEGLEGICGSRTFHSGSCVDAL